MLDTHPHLPSLDPVVVIKLLYSEKFFFLESLRPQPTYPSSVSLELKTTLKPVLIHKDTGHPVQLQSQSRVGEGAGRLDPTVVHS
jgi:hypothetical protein